MKLVEDRLNKIGKMVPQEINLEELPLRLKMILEDKSGEYVNN